MSIRPIKRLIKAKPTVEGAGVHLRRAFGFGATEDRRVTWLDAVIYPFRRTGALLELARLALVRLTLISVPFLAATGGIYWWLARTHDINYYLAERPPEFNLALAGAAVLAGALASLSVASIRPRARQTLT